MRCLPHCQTLRSSCDKAVSWVNNDWDRHISSKFNCIFYFLNIKEDRIRHGNESFTIQSQSSLSSSQLVNHVKSTWQPRSLSQCALFPLHTIDGHLHKETRVSACESTDAINLPFTERQEAGEGRGSKAPAVEQQCALFKSWMRPLASGWTQASPFLSLSLGFHICELCWWYITHETYR